MSGPDLARALDWAAAEGWNPGLGDAAAFHAADPGGFLMGWIGEEPVAAISVVRHERGFGFLGLYLCQPGWRGRGHGWALWQAGMELLGSRVIGLDGVVAQRENYARSGFVAAHRTLRWGGVVAPGADPRTRAAGPELLTEMIALDRAVTGHARPAFLRAWLGDCATRRSLALVEAGRVTGFGTIRACREGHKIGPLIAANADDAEALLRALVAVAGAGEIVLDCPELNAAGGALAGRLGLAPVFETARMYRGQPPAADLGRTFGAATLELG